KFEIGNFRWLRRKKQNTGKKNDSKTPTLRRHREKWGTRKIQGKFGIQWAGHPPDLSTLSRANRPSPSANLVSGCATYQALSPGPRFRSRIVKSLDHR